MTMKRELLESIGQSAINAVSPKVEADAKAIHGWRARYTNSRVFDSVDTRWVDLPSDGVLGIVVFHEQPYRTLVYGGDWYYLDNGMPACTATTWDGWVDPPDVPAVELKQAGAVDDERWSAIEEALMGDKRWPR